MVTVSGQLPLNTETAHAFVDGSSDEELSNFLLKIFDYKGSEKYDREFVSKLQKTWSD